MKLIMDFSDYQPWGEARDTYALIDCNNKLEDLDRLITDRFPDGLTETELNDILRFDREWILRRLGIELDDNDELE